MTLAQNLGDINGVSPIKDDIQMGHIKWWYIQREHYGHIKWWYIQREHYCGATQNRCPVELILKEMEIVINFKYVKHFS